MSEAPLHVAGGIGMNTAASIAQSNIYRGEKEQYESLKLKVLADEAAKKEQARKRRVSLGLPTEEEKDGKVKGLWRKLSSGRNLKDDKDRKVIT